MTVRNLEFLFRPKSVAVISEPDEASRYAEVVVRNLTAGEILGQILMARERLGDFPGGVRPNDGGLVPAPRGSGGSEGDSLSLIHISEPTRPY